MNIHCKGWCWSWSSNTLTTWCKDPTHWKRVDSLGKDLMWKTEGRKSRRGQRLRWLNGITDLMDMSLSKLRGMVKDREGSLAWCSPLCCRELDMTKWLNSNKDNKRKKREEQREREYFQSYITLMQETAWIPHGNFREVFPGYGNEWSMLHVYTYSSFCVEGTLVFKCLLRSLNKENLELLSDNIIESL